MRFADDVLMAYVDGELDAATRAAIDAALTQDRELAVRIERQRALRHAVHATYEQVLDEPMPRRLLEFASGAIPESDRTTGYARNSRANRFAWLRHWTWFEWGSMTASLAIGVLAGGALLGVLRENFTDPGKGLEFVSDGAGLRARGALARALSEQLAATQAPGAPVKVGLSFVSRSGEYCRTFTLERGGAAGRLGGLACRSGGEWRLELVAQDDRPATRGEFRTAASGTPPAVMRALDERIEGSTLDANTELEAQRRGWVR